MKLEKDRRIAFLDVLVVRSPDESLGHSVYWKPRHTYRVVRISDAEHLETENLYLLEALALNRYRPIKSGGL